jgi:glycosyltransferase involved in cell wall biosynthesis
MSFLSAKKVTVVIPTYNRCETINKSIDSVLNQTYENVDVLVIDDGSIPPVKLSSKYKDSSRVSILRMVTNSGVSAARNFGMKKSTGDFICFLDDDDEFCVDKIEKQISEMIRVSAQASVTGIKVIRCNKESTVTAGHSRFLSKKDLVKGSTYTGLMIRNTLIQRLEYDSDLMTGEDWDIYIRLQNEVGLYYLSLPLYIYNKSDSGSLTSSAIVDTPEAAEKRNKVVYKHREWLGEKNARIKIAKNYLSYLDKKESKGLWVMLSIKHSGLCATVFILFQKTLSSVFRL